MRVTAPLVSGRFDAVIFQRKRIGRSLGDARRAPRAAVPSPVGVILHQHRGSDPCRLNRRWRLLEQGASRDRERDAAEASVSVCRGYSSEDDAARS